ncbi:MAG TPA: DUF3160 domain-containing protein, partial [Candidatus Omnitrophota bacterium]|nr:DUF3160 domain-containing protein [Candidatus Omnitrophota bacterium]
LGIVEYGKYLTQSKNLKSPVSSQEVNDAQSFLKEQKQPRIMSSVVVGEKVTAESKSELQNGTQGFRFMGQRFTPDAFIFSSLTQGDEAADPVTGEKLPSSTTALMAMSALGDRTADPLVNAWIGKNAPESKKVLANRLAALKSQFKDTPVATWTSNLYWSWLYVISALFEEGNDLTGYPMFMRGHEWGLKDLQCSLGSWTELKHDTLLYAKQSYAELGAGENEGPIPAVPKGYVEPNLRFFDRLITLVKITKEGLDARGLLDREFLGREDALLTSLDFFRQIATKELKDIKITDDEFERLRTEASGMDSIVRPLPDEEQTENNARSALIADVHTDAKKGEVLYEANGIPNYIFVAVKDVNGTRLTKGLVFSYYEFTGPLGKRMTDEDWKKINYPADKNALPTLPDWAAKLIKQ